MDSLPPIPTPVAQRWREFRIQILPIITFVAILSMTVMMWRNFVQPSGMAGQAGVVKANAISSHGGIIAELHVELSQSVTNSQVIGTIVGTDPDVLKAAVATVEAELPSTRP